MKMRNSFILSLLAIVSLVCSVQGWSQPGRRTYYYQLTATASPTDGGLVYASNSSSTPSESSYQTTYTSSVLTTNANGGGRPGQSSTTTVTVYYYAKPNNGYVFVAWQDADGTTVSTDANASFSVTASSTSQGSPTAVSYTAVFASLADATETTLAALAGGNATENAAYKVTGANLVSVAQFTAQDGSKYLVVRDDENSANHYVDVSQLGDVESMITDQSGNEVDQREYRQNNWMLVKVSDDDYEKYECCLSSVTGVLTNSYNLIVDATGGSVEELVDGQTPDTKLNTYTPVNLNVYDYESGYYTYNSLQDNVTYSNYTLSITSSNASVRNYFFMPPKRCELAEITWLGKCFCGYTHPTNGLTDFYLPSDSAYNPHKLPGGIAASYIYNESGQISFKEDYVYTLKAVVMEIKDKGNGYATSAPKRASTTTVTPWKDGYVSQNYVIYFIGVTDWSEVTTSVKDVQAERQVQSVSYYDLSGRMSAQPFDGVNVVVTLYTDGTRESKKIMN